MDPATGLSAVKAITPGQFTLFRIAFGGYLALHFLLQLPEASELFSNRGVLADARLNPLYGLFPNPLAVWGSPLFVTVFIAALAGLSLAFAAGAFRRTTALLLWFGWAALFNRNNLISNPSLPYLRLLLLLCTLVPPGEPMSLTGRAHRERWFFPAMVFWSAWILMAAGYTFSGVVKLDSPSWLDGTAFRQLLDNPLARPGLARETLLGFGATVHAAITWSILALEILFLPLCLFRAGRAFAWTTMLLMHLGIVLAVDFADLTFGMVMLHLFTFDPAWLPVRRDSRRPMLFYDGECGLCHAVVRFLRGEDPAGRLAFAPLQSEPAQAFLRSRGLPTEDFDSLVLVRDHTDPKSRHELRTTAVLRALDEIGGLWRLMVPLRWIPAPWRDPLYKAVARVRYRIFGAYVPPATVEGRDAVLAR